MLLGILVAQTRGMRVSAAGKKCGRQEVRHGMNGSYQGTASAVP
jgi:hypothetical protein